MRHGTDARSNLREIGHAVVATLIGLIGVPVVSATNSAPAWVWLGLATLASVWLLFPAPTLARGLERLLGRAPNDARPSSVARAVRQEIARLVVAIGYVVVLQAIIRRPLVETFGAAAEPFVAEASFGATALTVLIFLLTWTHRASKSLVEACARYTLDMLVATSGSEAAMARTDHATAPAPTVQSTSNPVALSTVAGATVAGRASR